MHGLNIVMVFQGLAEANALLQFSVRRGHLGAGNLYQSNRGRRDALIANLPRHSIECTGNCRDFVDIVLVEVHILGQRMLLKSNDDARHIERLATYVKRKIDEVAAHGPVSTSKLAVLAALNIADDYFRSMDEAREFKRSVAEKSRAILANLDD